METKTCHVCKQQYGRRYTAAGEPLSEKKWNISKTCSDQKCKRIWSDVGNSYNGEEHRERVEKLYAEAVQDEIKNKAFDRFILGVPA